MYLYAAGYATSTVNNYVSSIGYFHRLSDVPDPTKVGHILELLKGYVNFVLMLILVYQSLFLF